MKKSILIFSDSYHMAYFYVKNIDMIFTTLFRILLKAQYFILIISTLYAITNQTLNLIAQETPEIQL